MELMSGIIVNPSSTELVVGYLMHAVQVPIHPTSRFGDQRKVCQEETDWKMAVLLQL